MREKLRKLLPSSQPQVDSIADIAREEVRQSFGVGERSKRQPHAMSYAAAGCRDVLSPRPHQDATPPSFRRQTPLPPPPPTSHRSPLGQRYISRKIDLGAPLTITHYATTAGRLATSTAAASSDRCDTGDLPSTCRVRSWVKGLATSQITSPENSSKNDDHTVPSPSSYISPHRRQYTGPIRGRSPSPHLAEN